MAIFQNMAGKKLSDQLTLFVGNVMQIKIIPGKGELVPFRLTVAPANFMKLLEDHTRKTANFEIYKLKAAAQGSGQFWANNDKGVKAGPINVTVKQPLTLPTGNENQLALIKLLLAESPSPAYANYNIATFKTGMQWMRLVVENRLKMKSYLVGSEGATTLIDVIKARNQFEGFGVKINKDNSKYSLKMIYLDMKVILDKEYFMGKESYNLMLIHFLMGIL